MNHFGNANKMVETPRTTDRVVFIDGNPWVNAQFARSLERELNAANDRINRLEEFVDQLTNPKFTRDDLHKEALLQYIKRLEEAGDYIVEENDIHIGKEVWRKAKEAKP